MGLGASVGGVAAAVAASTADDLQTCMGGLDEATRKKVQRALMATTAASETEQAAIEMVREMLASWDSFIKDVFRNNASFFKKYPWLRLPSFVKQKQFFSKRVSFASAVMQLNADGVEHTELWFKSFLEEQLSICNDVQESGEQRSELKSMYESEEFQKLLQQLLNTVALDKLAEDAKDHSAKQRFHQQLAEARLEYEKLFETTDVLEPNDELLGRFGPLTEAANSFDTFLCTLPGGKQYLQIARFSVFPRF